MGPNQFTDWTGLLVGENRSYLLGIQEQVTLNNFGQWGKTWLMIHTGKMQQPVRWQPLKNRVVLRVALSQAGNNINHLDMQQWGVLSNQASEKYRD